MVPVLETYTNSNGSLDQSDTLIIDISISDFRYCKSKPLSPCAVSLYRFFIPVIKKKNRLNTLALAT